MKTSGLFTTHEFVVPIKSLSTVYNIIPFGDVHFGAPGFSLKKWKDFINKSKRVINPIFIGMGDYMDFASSSERKAIEASEFHESTMHLFDTVAYRQMRDFQKEIEWMHKKGLFLGLIGGNHNYKFSDGKTSDEKICQNMNVPFLGACCMIRIKFKYKTEHINFDIYAHHGRGAGRTVGASYNALETISRNFFADLYLMGHDHGRGIVPGKERLVLDEDRKGKVRIIEKTPYFGRTGSFLKSYEKDCPSYIVDSANSPASLGNIMVRISFKASVDDLHPRIVLEGIS